MTGNRDSKSSCSGSRSSAVVTFFFFNGLSSRHSAQLNLPPHDHLPMSCPYLCRLSTICCTTSCFHCPLNDTHRLLQLLLHDCNNTVRVNQLPCTDVTLMFQHLTSLAASIMTSPMDPSRAISECIQARDKYAKLDNAAAATTFCTSHKFPHNSLLPVITVDGVDGQLAFPLPPSQCKELIRVAQQAPFGRGEKTIVDTAVRNTWQIDSSCVHLDPALLADIRRVVLPRVCSDLGLSLSPTSAASSNDVEARLYKLLVYETGGMFRPHRDSEKESGMFGTLVVLLPAAYTGGELVVEHAGQRRTIDRSGGEQWRGFSYAAFYADCKHEVREVTSGYRVALTFNLCKRGANSTRRAAQSVGRKPAIKVEEGVKKEDEDAGDDSSEDSKSSVVASSSSASPSSLLPSAAALSEAPGIVRQLAAALRDWYTQVAAGSAKTSKYVLMLEHEYTQGSLSVQHLKNHDRALMVLVEKAIAFAESKEEKKKQTSTSSSAASLPPIIPLLCLFTVTRMGDETYDSDEYRITDMAVKHIAPPASSSVKSELTDHLFSSLVTKCTPSLHESDLLYTKAEFNWADEGVDEEEEEYTGNEGTTIERWYYRAGLMLLPTQARWRFITGSMEAGAVITELQDAASVSSSTDLEESVQLAQALHSSLAKRTSLYPAFLNALSGLYSRASQEHQGNGPPSSSMKQLSSLMDRVFEQSAIDFSDLTAPTQLDKFATARGMDVLLRERLVSAFKRCLTKPVDPPSAPSSSISSTFSSSRFSWASSLSTGPPLSLVDAAKFLLRLFLLDSQSSSAASTTTSPPVYNGSHASMVAICKYVLSSPVPHASFTFPSTLTRPDRHQLHMIADHVGYGALEHESTGMGSRRALTITRVTKHPTATRDKPAAAADPLAAFVSALPQSADTAHLPPQWVRTASEMCEVLGDEMTADKLKKKQSVGNDLSATADLVVTALLLCALYREQVDRDVAHRADYTDQFAITASSLCQFASDCIESKWSKAPADKPVLQSMEKKLINPLFSLMDVLARHQPSEGEASHNTSQSALLSAFLPLPHRLHLWLQAQLAALPRPSASSWEYPTDLSPLFSRSSTPSFVESSYEYQLAKCTCDLCQQLHRFLRHAKEQSSDFTRVEHDRKHVEARIRMLGNPHIECETIKGRSPYTLRVVKGKKMAEMWEERRAALKALVERLDTSIATIQDSLAAFTTSSSSSAASSVSPTSRRPLKPVNSQRRLTKAQGGRKGRKRKHEVVELDEDDDEQQKTEDKENKRQAGDMSTARHSD